MSSSHDLSHAAADDEAFARPTFEVLYAVARSYLPEALRLSRVPPADVDDLVHDIVLVAYRGLDRYAPKAGPRGEPPDSRRSLKAWLSAIAWRVAARRRGKAYRRLELPHEDTADLLSSLDDAPTTEQLAAATQRRRILAGVLHKLRPERAEVLLMHTFLEMSVPDIAEELGLNPNTVKSRIGRARQDAIAAVKRLSPDEQSVLEGSPLLLPFALDPRLDLPDERPRAFRSLPAERPRAFRDALRISSLAAGAAGILAVGMALGAGLSRQGRQTAETAPIAAAHEAALADSGAAVHQAPPTVPALVFGAPSASSPPQSVGPRGAAPGTESRALARELVWITAARRALHERAGDRALAALKSHEAEFPRGVLARDREMLKEEARALSGSDRREGRNDLRSAARRSPQAPPALGAP